MSAPKFFQSLASAGQALIRLVDNFDGNVVAKGGGDSYLINWLTGADMSGYAGSGKLQRPYEQSPWVRRAIKMVTEPIAAADLLFTTDQRGGKKQLNDPKVNQFWQRPARDVEGLMTYAAMMRATGAWYALAGEAFWLLGDEWLTNFAPRQPFIIARPDRMRAVINTAGKLIGWIYKDGVGKDTDLKPENVVHFKDFNPYNDTRGSSDYAAGKVAAESDYSSGLLSRNVAQSNGDRGRFVVAKGEKPLSDAQKKQIEAGLRSRDQKIQSGEPQSTFLTGDVSVEDPKIQSVDSAFLQQRTENRYEIAAAFGIPLTLFSVAPRNSIRGSSDGIKLIEDTCIPMAGVFADHIEQLTMRLGPIAPKVPIYCELSFANHTAVREAKKGEVDSLVSLAGIGIPVKSAGEWLRMDLPEFPGNDIGHLPFTVQPVADANAPTNPTTNPALAEPGIDPATGLPPAKSANARVVDPFEKMIEAMGRRNPADAMVRALENAPEGKKGDDDIWKATDAEIDAAGADLCAHGKAVTGRELVRNDLIGKTPKRDNLWAAHMAARRPIVKMFIAKARKAMMDARSETLKKIEFANTFELKSAEPIKQRKSALELIFDVIRLGSALVVELSKVEYAALDTAGQQFNDEIGIDDPWKTPNAEAISFVASRENKIRKASQTIFDQVRAAIDVGLTNGDTMDQIAEAVKSKFNDLMKWEAMRIAQTETAAAYGYSRDLAMKKAGTAWKEWLTSRNNNVRPWHQQAEAQQQPLEHAFEVGPDLLMYPGDPKGEPANIINCHCVSIAIKAPPGAEDNQP